MIYCEYRCTLENGFVATKRIRISNIMGLQMSEEFDVCDSCFDELSSDYIDTLEVY